MYSKLPSLESQLQYSFEMIHQYLGTISYQELINLGWAGLWAQARYQIYIGCLEESLDTQAHVWTTVSDMIPVI